MKRTLLVAGGALFLTSGTALAAPALAAPTLYGKFYIALDRQADEIGLDSEDADGAWRFVDSGGSSRLGITGSEDLGVADLRAIYRLEYGIDPDGSEGEPFSERNIYVGVQGGFGTLQFGKFDTPVKEAGSKVDQFNDESIGDIKFLMPGETRNSDLIQYTSPKVARAFSFVLTLQPGEGRTSADDVATRDTGLADTIYAGVKFASGTIAASLAYANDEHTDLSFDGPTVAVDILRASAMWTPGDFEIGVLAQRAEGVDQQGATDGAANGGDFRETSWLLSGAYSLDALKFKGQYGQTDGDGSGLKRTGVALGVDYKLSKSLTTQAYYVAYEQRGGGAPDDLRTDSYGVALVYSF